MAMTNLEIKDFTILQGLNDTDFIVVSLAGGTSGKIIVRLMKEAMTKHITPSIRDGVWWIGETDQGVNAVGQTPQFRKGEFGIEYKYATEDDTAWLLLVPFDDIKFKFEELTDEQKDELSLHFSDLTEDDIQTLQQPAKDMINELSETNKTVMEAEAARVTAENNRVAAEKARVEAETARKNNFAELKAQTDAAISNTNAAAASANKAAQDAVSAAGTANSATNATITAISNANAAADNANAAADRANSVVAGDGSIMYVTSDEYNSMFSSGAIQEKCMYIVNKNTTRALYVGVTKIYPPASGSLLSDGVFRFDNVLNYDSSITI